MSKNNNLSVEDQRLINKLFWNSFLLEHSYNYERQQALGFALGMWPAIKEFHKTKEDQSEALIRHMQIFNTTPHVASAITGMAAALEKEASENEEFDKDIINQVKVSLMGPFAGIGDSFFWGTLRIIATAIALPLSQQGSILGPILFLVAFNVPHVLIRYYGTVYGYRFGTDLMENVSESGVFKKISKAATIVGLIVIGAMAAQMVRLETTIGFSFEDTTVLIQEFIDQIFPLLLPLLYTGWMFSLLKKGKKSTYLLVITIVIGIGGALLGIF